MSDIAELSRQIDSLLSEVSREGDARAAGWQSCIEHPDFAESARNLAHYLALRHRDLRPLQRPLMQLGLSSLGRLESRVLPGLRAVRGALAALAGRPAEVEPAPDAFFAGEARLAERSRAVFGPPNPNRPVSLLVTCPATAAEDPSFMLELAARGVEALRINCAHDDAAAWQRMIDHARAAERATGRRFKILMDLAGPKIRTGAVRLPRKEKRIARDDLLAVVPPGGLDAIDVAIKAFAVECTLPQALAAARPGHRLFVDDGKLGAVVESVADWGFLARVTRAEDKGLRLKSEKGLNFPDSDLQVAALTDKDRGDLDFVAAHADGIGFSFVQSAGDVALLQAALADRRPDDWRELSLILKIETPRAVRNLPDILVQAAGRQPTAIMIARGDLAVEIGFARLAEMQEEILWIGEAAHVPVIWATQVLEHLIKKGTPSRGEMTDAAMAARAECVMLNKGPYLLDAIAELDTLLGRMEENQHKKTPQLRALRSW
ncbi:pyruvate kinase [Pelagibius sp. 7325]|uniref:pyruvate kinase n=1 Tax=Pelagibius sp. 7325 TaxID=3131994 RepID=UPI0030EBDDED